jgi:hypothetical protein
MQLYNKTVIEFGFCDTDSMIVKAFRLEVIKTIKGQWCRTEMITRGGGGGGGGDVKVTRRGGCNIINMESSNIYFWF